MINPKLFAHILLSQSRNEDTIYPNNLASKFDLSIPFAWDIANTLQFFYVIWVFAAVIRKTDRPWWPFIKIIPLYLLWHIIFRVSGSVLHYVEKIPGNPYFDRIIIYLSYDTIICFLFWAVMVTQFSLKGRKNYGVAATVCALIFYFIFFIFKIVLVCILYLLFKTANNSFPNPTTIILLITLLYATIMFLSNGDPDLSFLLLNFLLKPFIQPLIKLFEKLYGLYNFWSLDLITEIAFAHNDAHIVWWDSLKKSVKKDPNYSTNIRLARMFDPLILALYTIFSIMLVCTANIILIFWTQGDIYVVSACLHLLWYVIDWIRIYFSRKK